jgi:hypothetical protein
VSEDSLPNFSTAPLAAHRAAGQHARGTARRYKQRAIVAVAALVWALILGITVLELGWATVALDAVVIAALLLIENTADPIIQRWARGARHHRAS